MQNHVTNGILLLEVVVSIFCDKDCHGMSMLSSGILQKLKEDEHVKSLETVPEDKIKNLVLVTE